MTASSATPPYLSKIGAGCDEVSETLTESPDGLRESQHILTCPPCPPRDYCGREVVKVPPSLFQGRVFLMAQISCLPQGEDTKTAEGGMSKVTP